MKLRTLYLALIASLVVACEKEPELCTNGKQEEGIQVIDSRLAFSSTNKFAATFNQLKSEEKQLVKNEAVLVNALGKNNYELFKQKNFLNPSKTLDSNEELEDTLVSDPVFKSLLNKDREIEVEGTIFKITPHGTFAFLPEKRLKVEEIIMSLDAGKTIKQQKLSEYFYQIDTGVVRYDTFKEMADNTIDITSEIQEKNDTYSKSSENEDIATHYIKKKHTIVGSALQNKFGFNKTVRRELNSRRRIKVSFSCPNYLVLTYVTASITYQKKNWIGWSKTSAEKLAFGWDGLVVSLNGAPAFNVTAPRTS